MKSLRVERPETCEASTCPAISVIGAQAKAPTSRRTPKVAPSRACYSPVSSEAQRKTGLNQEARSRAKVSNNCNYQIYFIFILITIFCRLRTTLKIDSSPAPLSSVDGTGRDTTASPLIASITSPG